MAIVGTPRQYHHKYKFLVEIDGYAVAGFQKCSELSGEVAVLETNEGGTLYPDKNPGRVKFSDVTLDRGACFDLDSYNWFKEVVNAPANAGKAPALVKRTVDIVQQERDGTTVRRWRLFKGWPNKFVAGDWDNDADEVVTESLTICFNYFDMVK